MEDIEYNGFKCDRDIALSLEDKKEVIYTPLV